MRQLVPLAVRVSPSAQAVGEYPRAGRTAEDMTVCRSGRSLLASNKVGTALLQGGEATEPSCCLLVMAEKSVSASEQSSNLADKAETGLLGSVWGVDLGYQGGPGP